MRRLIDWLTTTHSQNEYYCPTCEVLKEQLAVERKRVDDLINKLTTKPEEPKVELSEEEKKPIVPHFVPWHVRQKMLEAEDREKARILKIKEEELRDLEDVVVNAPSTTENVS